MNQKRDEGRGVPGPFSGLAYGKCKCNCSLRKGGGEVGGKCDFATLSDCNCDCDLCLWQRRGLWDYGIMIFQLNENVASECVRHVCVCVCVCESVCAVAIKGETSTFHYLLK